MRRMNGNHIFHIILRHTEFHGQRDSLNDVATVGPEDVSTYNSTRFFLSANNLGIALIFFRKPIRSKSSQEVLL